MYIDVNVKLDIDEIIDACSTIEKRRLYEALSEEDDIFDKKEQKALRLNEEKELMQQLRSLTPYELKKTLCDLLYVASYQDELSLRTALETVIKAN